MGRRNSITNNKLIFHSSEVLHACAVPLCFILSGFDSPYVCDLTPKQRSDSRHLVCINSISNFVVSAIRMPGTRDILMIFIAFNLIFRMYSQSIAKKELQDTMTSVELLIKQQLTATDLTQESILEKVQLIRKTLKIPVFQPRLNSSSSTLKTRFGFLKMMKKMG